MLANVSIQTPQLVAAISNLVGKPFSLQQRKFMEGALSPKLLITKCNVTLHNLLILDSNPIKTCQIELRPKGIITRFVSALNQYAFIIPYHQLNIQKEVAGEYTITYNLYYMNVLVAGNSQVFMDKLVQQKLAHTPKKPEDL